MSTDVRGHVEFFKTEVNKFTQMAAAYGGCTTQEHEHDQYLHHLSALDAVNDEMKARRRSALSTVLSFEQLMSHVCSRVC